MQLLGVLREVVALGREGAAEHSTSSLLFDVADGLRRLARLAGPAPPAHRRQRPADAVAAHASASTTRVQRLAALEGAPEISPEVLLARSRAALEAGQLDRVDDAVQDAAGRRPLGVARRLDVGPGRPRPPAGRPRRRARSTRSTGRCPASWRPSWHWRSPARPAARPTSPSRCTWPAPAPTPTTSPRQPSAWPGSARAGATSTGAVRALDLVPGDQPGVHPGAAAPGRPARRVGWRAALAGGGARRASTTSPSTPSTGPASGSRCSARRWASWRRTAPTPAVSIAGRPAAEPALRDGLEAAYRDLAGYAPSREERVAPRRPGQRGAPMDAAMTADRRADAGGERDGAARSARRARARSAPASGSARPAAPSWRPQRQPAHRHRGRGPSARRAADAARGRRRWRATSAAARSPTTATAPSAGPRRAARATTSPSSRRHGSQPCATAASATRATRTPSRWTPGPSRAATRCWSSATASPRRPTPTSPASRRPAPRATSWPRSDPERDRDRRRPVAASAKALDGGRERGQRGRDRQHHGGSGQPGLVHVRRRRRRRRRSSSWAGSATAGPTGCPTTGGAAAADHRRLVRRRADRRGRAPGRGGERAAGARHHPVARHRRPRPHPAHGARSTSTARGGCWSAPTGCGTTARSRRTWPPWCASTGRAAGRRAARRWPAPWSTGPTPRAAGQHHVLALARIPARTHPAAAHPRHTERKPARWQRSQLTSTRTSSCPTAAPTSTPSSPSPAPAPARPGSPGRATPREIVIVDTSGSMGGDQHRGRPAGRGGRAGPGARRRVVRGHRGQPRGAPGLPAARRARPWCGWTPGRARGQGRGRPASGPTAARRWAPGCGWPPASSPRCPAPAQRHAILLTDGINQHETPEQLDAAIEAARGRFQCDCRGVGADWQVAEVRRIATALLGSVDLIASRSKWPPTSSGSCGSRWAAGSPRRRCGCGRRRVPRCSSSARSPRPSRTSPPDGRRSTR